MMHNDEKLIALAKEWRRLDTAWLTKNRMADEADAAGRTREARKMTAAMRMMVAEQRKLTTKIARLRATTADGLIAKISMIATFQEFPLEGALREAIETGEVDENFITMSICRDAALLTGLRDMLRVGGHCPRRGLAPDGVQTKG